MSQAPTQECLNCRKPPTAECLTSHYVRDLPQPPTMEVRNVPNQASAEGTDANRPLAEPINWDVINIVTTKLIKSPKVSAKDKAFLESMDHRMRGQTPQEPIEISDDSDSDVPRDNAVLRPTPAPATNITLPVPEEILRARHLPIPTGMPRPTGNSLNPLTDLDTDDNFPPDTLQVAYDPFIPGRVRTPHPHPSLQLESAREEVAEYREVIAQLEDMLAESEEFNRATTVRLMDRLTERILASQKTTKDLKDMTAQFNAYRNLYSQTQANLTEQERNIEEFENEFSKVDAEVKAVQAELEATKGEMAKLDALLKSCSHEGEGEQYP